MTRLYLDTVLIAGAEQPLPEAAHRYLVQVLRLTEGDGIQVFDGRGHEAPATLISVSKRGSTLRIGVPERPERESPLDITLLQCVSKGDRMDLTLQKAVELGVTRIQPLRSERSVVRLDAERWAKKCEHWSGILVSACEQSGRVMLPALLPVAEFEDALAALPSASLKLALLPGGAHSLRELDPEGRPIALLIGPEGGLSAHERAQALATGFVSLRLGPRILRTETAGLATLAALQALWGDWGAST